MDIDIKDVDQCVKEITIIIPAEQAQKDYYSVLQKFKNYVAVPGFRKGKAPLSMVDNLFFEQARETYLKEKVFDYYETALKENNIKPLYEGIPTDVDWDKGKDLKIVFRYEIEPEVKITKYKELEVPYKHTEFSEEMIDSTIENIRSKMAKEEPVDGAAEAGDQLTISVESVEEGHKKQEIFNDINQIKLSENNYGDDFNNALKGSVEGDTVETVMKKDDKEYKVRVTVKDIKRITYPEINEEFVKEADFESLENMRQDIEKNLRQQVESANLREKQNSLLLALMEHNPFDIPPTSVMSYSHKLAEPYARLLNKKPEELANYYAKTAFFEIKSYYIVSELLKEVPLEITEEDEQATISELANEMNLKTEEYMEKNPDVTKKEEFVNRIKEKKLFEYLMANNTFVPKEEVADEAESSGDESTADNDKTEKEE